MRTLILLLICLTAGCGLTPDPDIEVASVELLDTSPEGARLRIVLAVTNTINEPVELESMSYRLKIDQVDPFEVEDQPSATLPSGGTQRLDLYAAVPTAAGNDLIGRDYRVSGTLTYDPPGDLRVVLTETGVPLPWVGFAGRGAVVAGNE